MVALVQETVSGPILILFDAEMSWQPFLHKRKAKIDVILPTQDLTAKEQVPTIEASQML